MSSSLLLFSTVDFVKSRHKHSVLGRCQHDDVLVFSEQLNRFAGFGIGLVRLVFTFFSLLVVYQVKSVDFNVKKREQNECLCLVFSQRTSSLIPASCSGDSVRWVMWPLFPFRRNTWRFDECYSSNVCFRWTTTPDVTIWHRSAPWPSCTRSQRLRSGVVRRRTSKSVCTFEPVSNNQSYELMTMFRGWSVCGRAWAAPSSFMASHWAPRASWASSHRYHGNVVLLIYMYYLFWHMLLLHSIAVVVLQYIPKRVDCSSGVLVFVLFLV